jgi:hypothetical protein
MRTIEISTATKTLSEYANEIGEDILVLTADNKPVAAIVSLKHIDSETLALSTNADFMALIDQARSEVAAGRIMSLEAMKKAVLP